ncbi:MAG: hypothetical protein NT031_20330 [Planctomycetota bacterium]|nr:hypothetical protein [Planctomycetota bacterium]
MAIESSQRAPTRAATPRRAPNLWRWTAAALVVAAGAHLLGSWGGLDWPGRLAQLGNHLPAAGACLALSAAFIACKGLALCRSAARAGIHLNWPAAARLFVEGAVVELGAWPGKVLGDAYRVTALPEGQAAMRIQAVGGFRLATLAAAALLAAPALPVVAGTFGALSAMVACGGLAVGGLWLAKRFKQWRSWRDGAMAATPPAVAAALTDVGAAALLAWALTGTNPAAFAPWYVAGAVLGALSQMPLGLGVADACCWAGLTRMGVAPADATAVVVSWRLLGSGSTVLAGVISLGARSASGILRYAARQAANGVP